MDHTADTLYNCGSVS